MDHHHCHCPPVDHGHHHYSPPPCEQQDSSWNTPDHCHSPCHPPCPPPPPPRDDQQDYSWPPFRPTPFPMLWSSSSSDADVPYCTTVRVEAPAATTGDEAAPLLESKVHGGGRGAAPTPSGTEVLFVLLFWAVVAGFVYWYWFC